MRVLLFGTYDTSAHPRVATIAEGLRATGAQVTECNAPLGLDTAARVGILAHPLGVPALMARIARCWVRLAWDARRMPAPDAVLVGYLGHFDVHLARLLFRRVPVVLDHLTGAADTARDRRLDGGLRQAAVRLIDSAALRAADIIVVDTEEHRAALPGRHRGRAVVVPVGAPAPWYEAGGAASPGPGDGPLRVVFYGLYTPLQGTPVIGEALARIAGAAVEVTMIGNGQDQAAAKAAAAANGAVRWLDWVPAADLPAVVAGHHVCLGIFGTGEKALRVVPNKVFQGAAAGCAIVTSDTAPQRRALGDAAVLVPPGDPGALAGALLRLAADRAALARLREQAHALARERFTPAQIVAPLTRELPAGGGLPPGATRPARAARGAEEGGRVKMTSGPAAPGTVAPLSPTGWLRYDVVRRMLPDGVTDVLEVGCGQGGLAVRLAQRYHYLGVEPDPGAFGIAQRRIAAAGRGEVRNTTVGALGDERFDLVCAFEVLEHIEDDVAAVKEWAARLRTRGWLMLSVPADQHRYGPADELVGHFRRYEPGVLTGLLRGCGFESVEVRRYGFPLGYALEGARNAISRRRLASGGLQTSFAERTAGSGRLLQPSGTVLAMATRWGTAPFRGVQRVFPDAGPGLVALARLGG